LVKKTAQRATSYIFLFRGIFLGHYTKEDEIDGANSRHWINEKHVNSSGLEASGNEVLW
jgi:hypothetical protein